MSIGYRHRQELRHLHLVPTRQDRPEDCGRWIGTAVALSAPVWAIVAVIVWAWR